MGWRAVVSRRTKNCSGALSSFSARSFSQLYSRAKDVEKFEIPRLLLWGSPRRVYAHLMDLPTRIEQSTYWHVSPRRSCTVKLESFITAADNALAIFYTLCLFHMCSGSSDTSIVSEIGHRGRFPFQW